MKVKLVKKEENEQHTIYQARSSIKGTLYRIVISWLGRNERLLISGNAWDSASDF
jgi:hypothetical protein